MNSDLKLNLPDLKPVKFSGAETLGIGTLPSVQYGLLAEKLRQSSSKNFQCSVFCPGKKCKYEGAGFWQEVDMALVGVYSTWITDDIVTMARPSTEIIEKYKLIQQFQEFGIKSLINLQERGEHSSCGVKLEKSGFTYDPQVFMENQIFYYNFDWKDYGAVPKTVLLDMVKVLSFALTEGKVAIHSHAGLGRTGVLVACYLVYTLRCKPNDAIDYVRSKRPDSVQTKSQVQSVQGFAQFVVPMFIVFANVIPRDNYRTSLNLYLKRQRFLLHGFESRLLKHVPKPVFMFCERLLSLIAVDFDPSQQLFSDPNRFLGYFSSRCRLLRIHFSSKKLAGDGAKWTLHLPKSTGYMNGILDEQRHCAPPSPPNGINEKDDRPFWNSPDSLSSPEDQHDPKSFFNHIGGAARPPDDVVLPFSLSEDELTGLEPELEFTTTSNPKSQSNTESSTSDPHLSKESKSNNEVAVAEEDADAKSGDEFLFEDGDVVNEEEDDPLEDLNSEECNAIIDSVLQQSPSEHNMTTITENGLDSLEHKKDSYASKDNKGCSGINVEDESSEKPLTNSKVIEALLADHYAMGAEFATKLRRYQRLLNNRSSAWDKVSKESDPVILSALLWSWLDQLKEPVLNRNDLSIIVIRADKPMEILQKLDNGTRYTTEYLIRFISQLRPKSTSVRSDLLRRLVASLTHQSLGIQGTLRPVGMEWNKLRQGTAGQVMTFVDKLYEMILAESGQKTCDFG